jgi:excinuclease ABC subunit C
VIGFAKERPDETAPGNETAVRPREGARYKGEDRVNLPRKKEPIYVSRWPAVLFLLQRLRDEAHRFAISYFRKVKEKEDFRSAVDGIPGIGARKKRDLLAFFGDVKKLRQASIEDLQRIEGIGPRMAERIHRFFTEGP